MYLKACPNARERISYPHPGGTQGFQMRNSPPNPIRIVKHITKISLNVTLKLDLYDKTTYKYTKDKNLARNQYTLFDSLRFNHSYCGSPPEKTYANKQSLLEEK